MKKAINIIFLFLISYCLYAQAPINLSELEAKLIEGKNAYIMGDFNKAIENLTLIVEQLEIIKSQRPLIQQEANLYINALNYLAQSYLGSDKEQEAQYCFATLIQFKPSFALDPILTSPKIINFFENLRKSLISYLSLSTNPDDATIFIDDQQISQGKIEREPLIAGSHKLIIERAGFATISKEIMLLAGKITDLGTINLTRNSSVCLITTYPPETEVILDGKTIGFTSKGAPPDIASYAKSYGLDPENFSAYLPVVIPDTLEHYIEFKKPCYEKEQIIVKFSALKDYYYDPIILKPSYSQIILNSKENGKVYIDGNFIGELKKKTFQVCSGFHKLTIKTSWGDYKTEFSLAKDEEKILDIVIKPSLLYLGIIEDPSIPDSLKNKVSQLIHKYLKNLNKYNLLLKDKETLSIKDNQKLAVEIASIILSEFQRGSQENLDTLLKDISEATDAHLFLFGKIIPEKISKITTFYLFSDLLSKPDEINIEIENENDWNKLFYLLDADLPLYKPMLPLILVNSPTSNTLSVIEIKNKNLSAIKPGDFINSVDGKKITSIKKLTEYLYEKKENKVKLEIYSPSTNKISNIDVEIIKSPYEIAFSVSPLLLNKSIVNLLKYTDGPNEEEKNLALFNIALIYMKTQDFNKALDYLNKSHIKKEAGINNQTIQYRIAQCNYELGYKRDAQKIFEALSNYSFSTLLDDFGPAVSLSAKSYLSIIK